MGLTRSEFEERAIEVRGTLWHDIHTFLTKVKGAIPEHSDEPMIVHLAKGQMLLTVAQYEASQLLARMGTGWVQDIEQAKQFYGKEYHVKRKKFR